MSIEPLHILLADDDIDDCQFFEYALSKIPLSTNLVTVHDGEQLMELLCSQSTQLPDVVFLDLNMPRKNGFECLAEIKGNAQLQKLPIIIFSTSFDQDRVNMLYQNGAQYFMRKPAVFSQLTNYIQDALTHINQDLSIAGAERIRQPDQTHFVLMGHNTLVS